MEKLNKLKLRAKRVAVALIYRRLLDKNAPLRMFPPGSGRFLKEDASRLAHLHTTLYIYLLWCKDPYA